MDPRLRVEELSVSGGGGPRCATPPVMMFESTPPSPSQSKAPLSRTTALLTPVTTLAPVESLSSRPRPSALPRRSFETNRLAQARCANTPALPAPVTRLLLNTLRVTSPRAPPPADDVRMPSTRGPEISFRWIWLFATRNGLKPLLQGPLIPLSAIRMLPASKTRIPPKRSPSEGGYAIVESEERGVPRLAAVEHEPRRHVPAGDDGHHVQYGRGRDESRARRGAGERDVVGPDRVVHGHLDRAADGNHVTRLGCLERRAQRRVIEHRDGRVRRTAGRNRADRERWRQAPVLILTAYDRAQ